MDVGIVVPTKFQRIESLKTCISSLREAGVGYVLLVAPPDADSGKIDESLYDQLVIQGGTGLANAINCGMKNLPEHVDLVNWIGDDDKLTTQSINQTRDYLFRNPSAGFVFGRCVYVSDRGKVLLTNSSGAWAAKFIRHIPDFLPQPGALIRKEMLEKVLPLDESLKFAFDLKMFIQLLSLGRGDYIPATVAAFCWHDESLSVANRKQSALEARRVRLESLRPFGRFIQSLIEVMNYVASVHLIPWWVKRRSQISGVRQAA